MKSVKLTPDLVESFAGTFLSPRYDDPKPTPSFHREGWRLYCSDHPQVALIAPRDHAKSTGFTFDYILAETLFRASDYVILIGSTEEKAAEQLSNISDELHDNDDLVREFKVKDFEVDTRTEIIVVMQDDYRFRVLSRGAEQRIRGSLWKGKRPNLIVCDDMEDDEQVESVDRRRKFRRWFFRAAKQALSKSGKIRVHGTILHEDSLLNRLRKMKTWNHLFYKAHNSFDDFNGLLWPDRWSEAALRLRRQEFIEDGDSAGYSQEFLNDPQDNVEAYLRRDDFIPMKDEDFDMPKLICVGWDFAISKADMANRTSYTVGGKDARNIVSHLDFRAGRWSPSEAPFDKTKGLFGWIDLMFDVEKRWSPTVHFVEGGQIWKSVENIVKQEMYSRDLFLNIKVINPVKDKATRGRSFQKRHRAGATRWDTSAEGYESAKEEMLRFTGLSAARLDDQFDSAATLHMGFDLEPLVEEEDFEPEEEFQLRRADPRRQVGRNETTGY
jgi:hypothetical protein